MKRWFDLLVACAVTIFIFPLAVLFGMLTVIYNHRHEFKASFEAEWEAFMCMWSDIIRMMREENR